MRAVSRHLRLLSFTAIIPLIFVQAVLAQTHSTIITVSSMYASGTGGSGVLMPFGTVCANTTGLQGGTLSVTEIGWGLVPAGTQMCGNVVNGAILGGITVPDANYSRSAVPFNYNFVIQQTDASGDATGLPVQINNVPNVTGSTWALDAYAPASTAPIASPVFGYGSVPSSCTSPSIWTTPTGFAYVCIGGVYVGFGGPNPYPGVTPDGANGIKIAGTVAAPTAVLGQVVTPMVNGNALPGVSPVALNTTIGAGLAYSVWQRQGTAISIPSRSTGLGEPRVLYDTNPVILTGNAHVFKMWFSIETGSNGGIWYAESVTGAPGTWSIYTGGPGGTGWVFTGRGSFVLHLGSTYYGWSMPGIACSTGNNIYLYTSSDGVTWGSGTVALSCSGTETGLGSESVVPDPLVNGQWDMIYESTGGGCLSDYCLNVATLNASTPVGTWVKYSGNPITPHGGSGADGPHYNVATGQWSMYGHYAFQNYCVDGSDLVRWTATSLTGPWTQNPTQPIWPSVITSDGCAQGNPTLVQANGNVYMFYAAAALPDPPLNGTIEEVIAYTQTFATLQSSTETTTFVPGDVVITPTQDSNVVPNNPYSVIVTKADGKTPVVQIDTANLVTNVQHQLVVQQSTGVNGTAVTLNLLAPGNTAGFAGSLTANWRSWTFTSPNPDAGAGINGWYFRNAAGAQRGFLDAGTGNLYLGDPSAAAGTYATLYFNPAGPQYGSLAANWRDIVITTPTTGAGSGHGFHVSNGTSDVFYVDSQLGIVPSAGVPTFSGNVGVNGTNIGNAALYVMGTANKNALLIQGVTTSGQSYGISTTAGTTSADYSLDLTNSGGGELFRVRGNGSVLSPFLKSTTGTRFICSDTIGNLTASATACSGT